ncbi:hypothetical protein A5865_001212, partial [Enterococcus sp. 12E11_DIV0728]
NIFVFIKPYHFLQPLQSSNLKIFLMRNF